MGNNLGRKQLREFTQVHVHQPRAVGKEEITVEIIKMRGDVALDLTRYCVKEERVHRGGEVLRSHKHVTDEHFDPIEALPELDPD